MANKPISALPLATTPLAGTELLPLVQSGATCRASVLDMTAGLPITALSFTPTDSTVPVNGMYLGASDTLTFATATTERLRITADGNIHTPAGAAAMTDGFIYIPADAGVPVGTPTVISGTVPMYYDTTGEDFYIYNGAWKKVTLT